MDDLENERNACVTANVTNNRKKYDLVNMKVCGSLDSFDEIVRMKSTVLVGAFNSSTSTHKN